MEIRTSDQLDPNSSFPNSKRFRDKDSILTSGPLDNLKTMAKTPGWDILTAIVQDIRDRNSKELSRLRSLDVLVTCGKALEIHDAQLRGMLDAFDYLLNLPNSLVQWQAERDAIEQASADSGVNPNEY